MAYTGAAVYFLGIDGGGTRTTAWLADKRGRILGRAVTGPSNPAKVGLESAARELRLAARRAAVAAGVGDVRFEAVCAGVAGASGPAMHRALLRAMRRAIPARRYILTHDAAIALECVLGSGPGVIVISGTGSIAFARDKNGRILRCGGWGSAFDDEGSGYDIGRKAVQAALAGFDGRGPRTRLGRDICRSLRLRAITAIAGSDFRPDQVAALFPAVHAAALDGDRVARQLCREAGRDLARLAAVLLSRGSGPKDGRRVVCAGGVFKGGEIVRRSFGRHVRRLSPGARVALLRRQPVEGALALAMRPKRSHQPSALSKHFLSRNFAADC